MRRALVEPSLQAEGQAQASIALERVLWSFIAAALVILIAVITLPGYTRRWLLQASSYFVISVVLLILNRRGYTRGASIILIVGVWAVLTVSALTGGGVATFAAIAFLIIIFAAGLLLGSRAGVATALVCILTNLVLAIMEATGHLPWRVIPYNPMTRWIGLTVITVVVMTLQYLGARATRDALRRSRSELEDRKRAEDALRCSEERLRALSGRLQSAREEEGTRIAREIHDELGGALTGLKLYVEGFDRALSTSENGGKAQGVREKIPLMTNLIDSTIESVRRISSELRPGVLDDLGLVAAIEWQTQQFQQRTGIDCFCDAGPEPIELSRDQTTAIFRVFQEILTNVLRHAQATRVEVRMLNDASVFTLEVKDNGRGITEMERNNARSLGLLGMRERVHLVGGEVSIDGVSSQGTTVTARVRLGKSS